MRKRHDLRGPGPGSSARAGAPRTSGKVRAHRELKTGLRQAERPCPAPHAGTAPPYARSRARPRPAPRAGPAPPYAGPPHGPAPLRAQAPLPTTQGPAPLRAQAPPPPYARPRPAQDPGRSALAGSTQPLLPHSPGQQRSWRRRRPPSFLSGSRQGPTPPGFRAVGAERALNRCSGDATATLLTATLTGVSAGASSVRPGRDSRKSGPAAFFFLSSLFC